MEAKQRNKKGKDWIMEKDKTKKKGIRRQKNVSIYRNGKLRRIKKVNKRKKMKRKWMKRKRDNKIRIGKLRKTKQRRNGRL